MKVSHRINHKGHHEAIIEIRWYASDGNFLVEAVGYGLTSEEAEKTARLMIGQARAKLNAVTAAEVVV